MTDPAGAPGPHPGGPADSPLPAYGPPPPYAPPTAYGPPATYGQPPPYGPPPYGPAPSRPVNGLSVAALVVGIAGMVFVWVPFAGALLPAAAVALGGAGTGRSRHTGTGRGMGIAGLVVGAVGVVSAVTLTTLFLIFWPRITACDDPGLTPRERAQCLRDQFGLPSPGDPPGVTLEGLPPLAVQPR